MTAGTIVMPHHEGVEQDGRGEREADRLDERVRGEHEAREHADHDDRGGRDHPGAVGEAGHDRLPAGAPWTCSSRIRVTRNTS